MEALLAAHGHRMVMEVRFVDLPEKSATPEQQRLAKLEPFGFVDGVSQPAIRGTYKALRGADTIHIVEAGEIILGYPDNRGNLPAGPTLASTHDPENALPIAASLQHGFADPIVNSDRDLGRNGTFLAIRQLEQNVDGFWRLLRGGGGRAEAAADANGEHHAGVRRRQARGPLARRIVARAFPVSRRKRRWQDRPLPRTGQGSAEAPAIAMSLPAPPASADAARRSSPCCRSAWK